MIRIYSAFQSHFGNEMLKFWESSNEQNLTEQKIVLTTILTRLSANKSSDREPFYLKIEHYGARLYIGSIPVAWTYKPHQVGPHVSQCSAKPTPPMQGDDQSSDQIDHSSLGNSLARYHINVTISMRCSRLSNSTRVAFEITYPSL